MTPPSLARRLLQSAGRHATAARAGCLARLDDAAPSTSGRTAYCSAASGASGAAEDSQEALRQALLAQAMQHVASRGWSTAALVVAARELGMSPSVVGLLPRGEAELVEHYMSQCNARALDSIAAKREQLQGLPLDARMADALQIRLELITPFIDSWPQALAIAARPSNVSHSLALLFSLCDGVWHAVGDDSTDATWYTKRAVIAGVYATTSLYMLTDYSPGFRDTWQALRRRVADGLALDASLQSVAHAAAGHGAGGAAQPAGGDAGAHQAQEHEAERSTTQSTDGGQEAAADGPEPSRDGSVRA
ncbi:Ubiquinone biosynthesis protein COQ9, mitochondrial [Tetrabaena socialis]|uniref:Ubiquinone biosynthesis protein n=1 Tax=Tetrabaena socialis TaxID=47790 RepID=A0A2J8A0C7_9CHLO|nr:Ubiquinone biosynthesis protein COQ9, mitochondrial [Tetrabaena socialis]|eukprot:PNH05981.1 Ubiquinone biosynthesis protein COQ9, mitochondrial [Tetrabaena socialis]